MCVGAACNGVILLIWVEYVVSFIGRIRGDLSSRPLFSNTYAGSGPRAGVSLSGSEVAKFCHRGLLPGGQHVVGRGAVVHAAGQRGEPGQPHALIEGERSLNCFIEGALKEIYRQVAWLFIGVFACIINPNLSFDAFQEGGLAFKGARRRDAKAADVPVWTVVGVAVASLYGSVEARWEPAPVGSQNLESKNNYKRDNYVVLSWS